MENKVFNKNLKTLKKKDELFLNELVKINIQEYNTEHVYCEMAQDGTPIIKFQKEGKEWLFNSQYAPQEIASKWVDNIGKVEVTATIMMFGTGNGSYIRELLKKTNETVAIVVYEPSIEVMIKILQEIDLSFWEERVYWVVKDVNSFYLDFYFRAFSNHTNLTICKFVAHTNYLACFQKESREYLEELQKSIKKIETLRNTAIWLGEGYYRNALMNIKWFDKMSILDQIEGAVGRDIPKDFPVIIVSAGPSLSKNIKELKKAKGKAFIIATDSALVGLFDEGIMPDAFATIEPVKELDRFADSRSDNIPLICPETARFEVLDKHKDKKVLMNNKDGFCDLLFKKVGVSCSAWDGGGSVATFCYTVARVMGFKTIILVGQDLAFTDNTRYYDQIKEWSDHETYDPNEYVEVEDIYGGKVKTSKDLSNYIPWFEKEIENHPDIETIDATQGGAKIHGSTIQDLLPTIEEKCTIEFDMAEYLRKLPTSLTSDQKKQMLKTIKKIPSKYNKFHKDVLEGIELHQKLLKMLQSKEHNYTGAMQISNDIGKVMKRIEKNWIYGNITHKIRKAELGILSNIGESHEDATEDALFVTERGLVILEAYRQELEGGVLAEVKQIIGAIKIKEEAAID